MAKEKNTLKPPPSIKVVRGKEKKRRATFCPNSSNRSLSKSRNKSLDQWSGVSKSALKKNNNELAKGLNRYKAGFAEKEKEIISLKSEIMALNQENNALRLQMDQSEELNGRKLRELKNNLNNALDNLFSLQDNISKSISITNSSLRASQASRASSSSSRISAPLSFTSRISGPPLQDTGGANGFPNMRFRDASNLVPHNSPPKNLPQNKVSPMVAGHAISRPRIQLARMDMRGAYIQAAQENVELVEAEQEQEVIEQEEAPEIMEPSPEHSPEIQRRRIFNLTVIGEESRLEESPSLMESPLEESIVEELMPLVEESSPLEDSPRIEATLSTEESLPFVDDLVPSPSSSADMLMRPFGDTILNDGNSSIEDSPGLNQSIQRRVRSTGTRVSRQRLLGTSLGLGRSDISKASPDISEISPSLSEASTSVSRTPASTVPTPSPTLATSLSLRCSPQVDMLRTTRYPTVQLSNLNQSTRSNLSLVETPLSASPVPVHRSPNPDFIPEDFPENPSDSFFERLGCDMDGPSWLFGSVKKNKKRKSAAKRLSTLLSDEPSESILSSLDCSDLTSESLEASGFIQSGEIRTSNLDPGSSRILDRTSNPGSSRILDRTSNPGSSRILDRTSDPGSSRILDRTSNTGSNKILDGTSYPGTSMILDRSVDEDPGSSSQLASEELETSPCFLPVLETSEPRIETSGFLAKLSLTSASQPLRFNENEPNLTSVSLLSEKDSDEENRPRSGEERCLNLGKKPLRLSNCYIGLTNELQKRGSTRVSIPKPIKPLNHSQSKYLDSGSVPSSPNSFMELTNTIRRSDRSCEVKLQNISGRLSDLQPAQQLNQDTSPSKTVGVSSDPVKKKLGRPKKIKSKIDLPAEPEPNQDEPAPGPSSSTNVDSPKLEQDLEPENEGKRKGRIGKSRQVSEPSVGKRKRIDDESAVSPEIIIGVKKKARSTFTKGKKCYTEKVSVGAANEKYDDEERNMDAVEACEEPEVQDTKGRKEIKKNSRSTLTHESEVPDIDLLEPEVVEGGREGEEERKDGKEPEEEGGRRGRRAASQISFKEPSLRGKMRQGDAGSSSVYNDFKPKTKGKQKKEVDMKTL